MPTENLSKYMGKSPSGVANSVIQNSKNVQMPLPTNTATKQAFNKKPVNVNKTGTR